jgi:uncharacterized membrane protein (UPF0136 family)
MTAYVLAVYLVLLVAGGLVGWLKAGSRVSLFTALAFAAALAVCGYGPVPQGPVLVRVLLGVLLAVFAVRWLKTRKFMPAGLMVIVTAAALALEVLPRGQ